MADTGGAGAVGSLQMVDRSRGGVHWDLGEETVDGWAGSRECVGWHVGLQRARRAKRHRRTGGLRQKEKNFGFLYSFSLNTDLVFKPGK
jgi:hypothetical protein